MTNIVQTYAFIKIFMIENKEYLDYPFIETVSKQRQSLFLVQCVTS